MEHRQSDKLQKFLGVEMVELQNGDLQRLSLGIENHGRQSAELYASATFPGLFGPLSKEDSNKLFKRKRLKGEWNRQLHIPQSALR